MTEIMRERNGFTQIAGALTIFFFLFVYYSPSAFAAAETIEQQTQARAFKPVGKTDEAKLAYTLQQIKEHVNEQKEAIKKRVAEESSLGEDLLNLIGLSSLTTENLGKLMEMNSHVEALHLKTMDGFNAIEQDLKDKNLPDIIMQRHYDAVAKYESEYLRFKDYLKLCEQADSLQDQAAAMDTLNTFMQDQQFTRSHSFFDPSSMPFKVPDASETRKPMTTAEDFNQLLGMNKDSGLINQLIDVAFSPAYAATVDLPTTADLAETTEIQITPGIVDLASLLNNDAIDIYDWVMNNIDFIPTYGSIQGSDMTMQTLQGNAFDTASLLIALLRTSNIPARYVYGTVRIPADQVMNWVGDVNNAADAQQVLGQGGIPNRGLVSGGVVEYIELEHTWVEAFVDFFPSRGVNSISPDSWVSLDASFKQYDYVEGFNVQSVLDSGNSLGIENDFTSVINQTQINEEEVSFQDLDVAAFEQVLNDAQSNLELLFEQAEVIARQKSVLGRFSPILPTSLPYEILIVADRSSELRNSFRQNFWFELFPSLRDRVLGGSVISYNAPLASLAGKKITLEYEPATQADRDTLASFLPNLAPNEPLDLSVLPNTLPGYLINLTAKFMLDDEVVSTAGPFALGHELAISLAVSSPRGGRITGTTVPVAGELLSINLSLQGNGQRPLLKDSNRTASTVLNQTGIAYFEELDQQLEMFRASGIATVYRQPSFGIFGSRVNPIFSFGIPRNVIVDGARIDVDLVSTTVVPNMSNITQAQIGREIGMLGSALEHIMPESYLSNADAPSEGVSSVKAIAVAVQEGQSIFSIDQSNMATVLPQLELGRDVETDMRNAINAGSTVITPQAFVNIGSYVGAGYIITDPETGSGAYRIAGGSNGGEGDGGLGQALTYIGLGALAGFVVPPAHSDTDSLCGDDASNFKTNWATLLVAAVILVLLVTLVVGSSGALAPALLNVVAILTTFLVRSGALIALLARSQAASAGGVECAVFISGNEHPTTGASHNQVTAHISDAIGGTSPREITYTGFREAGVDRSWFQRNARDTPVECNGTARDQYLLDNGTNPDCDEYPFASTFEGGEANFRPPNNSVSLRLIDSGQNRSHGRALGSFYFSCGLNKGSRFEVSVGGGATRGLDSEGNQCYP
ncbi:MAG: hypothetical protein GXP21_00175 [Gammaproteobacteria bacterium]|nr:hypothetical protein [Gammaproteobacteria bacterium]